MRSVWPDANGFYFSQRSLSGPQVVSKWFYEGKSPGVGTTEAELR